MTTANLLNVSPVASNVSMDTSKKLQEESLKVSEVFGCLMNQTVEFSNPMVDDSSSKVDVSKVDSSQTPAQSYDRYSYKDNKIEAAGEKTVEEKLEEAGVDMDEVSQEVVDTIKEEYGVTDEEIQELLDEMGLSVLDLLNPQNLVNFVVQLTGVASGEELLLDESFLKVMETLDNLTQNLMKDLNVDMEGLQEIISEFELVDETEVPVSFRENLENQMQGTTSTETTENVEAVSEEVVKLEVEVEKEDTKGTVNDLENQEVTLEKETDTTSLAGKENSNENSLFNQNQNSNEAVVTTPQNNIPVGQVTDTSFSQFTSYTSVDTVQIMEQIVEQMRVTISSERTSMEMQLNPENLGKVTVHVSANEEGVVNAQFTATNEIVKEALETQVATLRESLNQAGVKVDAIEVTVETHQFEQNLEQNQHKADEEQVQENGNKRRNLNLDSLDDLAGVMTEEETLVAQMMKDNGNSVDFTA